MPMQLLFLSVNNLLHRACSAKKRRLATGAEVAFAEKACSGPPFDWPAASGRLPPLMASQQDDPGPLSPVVLSKSQNLVQPLCGLSQPEMDSSCMEIEAAQRKLQEIEDRYENTTHVFFYLAYTHQ